MSTCCRSSRLAAGIDDIREKIANFGAQHMFVDERYSAGQPSKYDAQFHFIDASTGMK